MSRSRRTALRSLGALALAAAGGCRPDEPVPAPSGPARPLPEAPRFPLRVEAGRRQLLDASGRPFFVNGDSPWLLIVQLRREQVDIYLEDRRRKGINALLVELIEHLYATRPPRNVYGDLPFTTPGDFATPNERYFAHADHVIRRAGEMGMLVLLAPAYVGYQGGAHGWYRDMVANGADKLRAYGRYLGNRYRSAHNILWVDGGDYKVPDKALVRAVAEGILEGDRKPHTYHASRGTAAFEFWGTGERWLTVNSIYTDENGVVAAAHREYARSAAPFFLIEARYEGERSAGEQVVRRQAWQALLGGASGHVMGNLPVWKFAPGWRVALNSPGARSLRHLAELVAARPWWRLLPDLGATLLVDGQGADGERAAAACADDGSFALAYTPTARALSLDLSQLRGRHVRAAWLDPSSGTQAAIGDVALPATGRWSVRPPDRNASGFGDWVLLLDSIG